MDNFMLRFFICNLFISGIIVILLLVKQLFRNHLSSRMQYNLWLLLSGLLTVPFIPLRPVGFSQLFSFLGYLKNPHISNNGAGLGNAENPHPSTATGWINDFALSVDGKAPSIIGYLLSVIWITGILVMLLLAVKSSLRLRIWKRSALPLQNDTVRRLYRRCLDETALHRVIPIYSTAFLKSPVITGFLRPCIYIPIHLISDYKESDLRFMLLHELYHYKYCDTLISYLMNLAGIIYWFNPLVWYSLWEMRNDREVACDTSVLKMLAEDSYADYGNTLINLAEKVSLTPFPFTAGLGGGMTQMRKRIINIATYEKPSLRKKLKGIAAFILTAALLLGLAPFVSTYAADTGHYQWKSASNVSYVELSAYFDGYEGSFVMYDLENDIWSIHNMERALLRVAPNSTYKIYDALFGLEEAIITPEDSLITWNKERYPLEAWNGNQNLPSAMRSSVNWYFQSIDEQLGYPLVYRYIQKIGYGNENISGDFSTYWLESSLKISPVEQVELLMKLHDNSFGFAPQNINAVKDSLFLSSSKAGTFYGKTGTGRVADKDVNGWFVGYIETAGNTYFFATNIGADNGAAGSNAAEITMSILSDRNIWIQQ